MGESTLIQIRDAGTASLPRIAQIEAECFHVPLTEEQLQSLLPDDMHVMIEAVDEDGSILGYVSMMTVLDEGYINNVAVSSAARRRGIGDALIRELLRRAEERALSFVTLEVRASNAPAIGLYEKNSFRQVGIRKKYYEKPQEDAIIMTAVFAESGVC